MRKHIFSNLWDFDLTNKFDLTTLLDTLSRCNNLHIRTSLFMIPYSTHTAKK